MVEEGFGCNHFADIREAMTCLCKLQSRDPADLLAFESGLNQLCRHWGGLVGRAAIAPARPP